MDMKKVMCLALLIGGTISTSAQQIPPNSSFQLAGMYLGMSDSAIIRIAASTAWKFRDEDSPAEMSRRPETTIYLESEEYDDGFTCLGKGDPQYRGSSCLQFDAVNVGRYARTACYISWDATGFRREDIGELKVFATVVINTLQKRFGKPMNGAIAPNKISVASLARAEGQYNYSTIAKWEWRDGKGRKSKELRYVWVATKREGDTYSFFVVMCDKTLEDLRQDY